MTAYASSDHHRHHDGDAHELRDRMPAPAPAWAAKRSGPWRPCSSARRSGRSARRAAPPRRRIGRSPRRTGPGRPSQPASSPRSGFGHFVRTCGTETRPGSRPRSRLLRLGDAQVHEDVLAARVDLDGRDRPCSKPIPLSLNPPNGVCGNVVAARSPRPCRPRAGGRRCGRSRGRASRGPRTARSGCRWPAGPPRPSSANGRRRGPGRRSPPGPPATSSAGRSTTVGWTKFPSASRVVGRTLPPATMRAAVLGAALDVREDPLGCSRRDERAHLGPVLGPGPELGRLGDLLQPSRRAARAPTLVHDEPRRRPAHLAGVPEDPEGDPRAARSRSASGKHDHRALSAELERDRDDRRAASLGDPEADLARCP